MRRDNGLPIKHTAQSSSLWSRKCSNRSAVLPRTGFHRKVDVAEASLLKVNMVKNYSLPWCKFNTPLLLHRGLGWLKVWRFVRCRHWFSYWWPLLLVAAVLTSDWCQKTNKFSGTNQKSERRRPFGTGLVRHCPQGLFSPFFTFLLAIFFRSFRLSLAPTICPWVSEDVLSYAAYSFRMNGFRTDYTYYRKFVSFGYILAYCSCYLVYLYCIIFCRTVSSL